MKLKRKLETKENRDFWAFIAKKSAEVAAWPPSLRETNVFRDEYIQEKKRPKARD